MKTFQNTLSSLATLILFLFLSNQAHAQTEKFEAESATLVGVGVASSQTGYSGSGYIDASTLDSSGDKMTFTVNASSAGNYPLSIRYSCGNDKQNIVSINGASNSESFPGTTGWGTKNMGNVALNAGNNTIVIEKHWGWMSVDYIELTGLSSSNTGGGGGTGNPPAPAPPTTSNNLWEESGNDIYTGADRVGIGTSSAGKKLHIHSATDNDGIKLTSALHSTPSYWVITPGGYPYFQLGPNTKLRGNGKQSTFGGKVGITTTTPTSVLSLGKNSDKRLLSLWDNPNNWFGMGIQNAQMRFQVGGTSSRFSFYAGDNSEVMTVKGTGRVGIGTNNPTTRLSLGKSINNRILALWDNPDSWYGFGINTGQMRLQVGSTNARFAFMAGNNKEIMTMKGNGRIGINTTAPSKTFHLHAPGGDNGMRISAAGRNTSIILQVAGGDYGYLALGGLTKIRGNNNASHLEGGLGWGYKKAKLTNDQGGSIELGGLGTPYIDFSNNTVDYDMRIIQTDNNTLVIRGNNSGTKRLVVEGKIGAQEVRVSPSGWADYVFDEDYELLSLEEVEEHIEEEGHLPNVPSEEEILDEGIELGEIAKIQQEKIEELYLHMIDLNKKVESLMAENQALKNNK